ERLAPTAPERGLRLDRRRRRVRGLRAGPVYDASVGVRLPHPERIRLRRVRGREELEDRVFLGGNVAAAPGDLLDDRVRAGPGGLGVSFPARSRSERIDREAA